VYDTFDRPINYLRVSVTDRCNLRCTYCMPSSGVRLIPHDDVLSYEEIADVVRCAVALGISKVRLTGGEPLVRKGVANLVRMLAGLDGINDLAMTTNGALLEQYAGPLADAGLRRVNVSLDTLDPRHFREITRGGEVSEVLRGLDAAEAVGLTPIRLNCVVRQSSSETAATAVAEFAQRRGWEVRFIRQMDPEKGEFWRVDGGSGGDCARCNRLRLSSNGMIRPCLLSNLTFSVRDLGPEEAIRRGVAAKPESGQTSTIRMHEIGG